MRLLRELRQGAWYEIRTAVNNRRPLFQSRRALKLLARVLDDVSKRFDFEIRGLLLKDAWLVFCIKPADGFQLPRIMQWLKQTFAVRCNLLNGWTGHIWGDRYWSRIAEGEPPEGKESLTGAEAVEPLPDKRGDRPLSRRIRVGVRPLPGKPALRWQERRKTPFQRSAFKRPRETLPVLFAWHPPRNGPVRGTDRNRISLSLVLARND